jgi:holo-[acyl-carrier protein] synthase
LILGVGIDLLETARMGRALERSGPRFESRVFTEAEVAYCREQKRPEQRFAARFAAKEALLKALGTGWAKGIAWKEVEVRREPGGAPALRLSGRARELAEEAGVRRIHLSLSHLAEVVAAVVILEGQAG